MGVDKEYIIDHCKDKQTLYGIDICMLQTEPCKRAVEMGRCPSLWEYQKMTERADRKEWR